MTELAANEDAGGWITFAPGEEAQIRAAIEQDSVHRIRLVEGHYRFDRTLLIPSRTEIRGAGKERTTVELLPGSNCHLFTNADHARGNVEISASGFRVVGNGDSQTRPSEAKALTFACAFYFKRCRNLSIVGVDFFDIRQTAMHFNGSVGITVLECHCRRLGWSGLSTSDASALHCSLTVEDAGRDHMHSAIHLDGGVGITCEAIVSDTTGNGIMLDSAYGELSNCVVRGSATGCKRGVSLSGSAVKPLENVLISGDFSHNREIGIMVSNSAHVTIHQARVVGNGEAGILMQGRNGGRGVIVFDCELRDNGENVREIHASAGNWVHAAPPLAALEAFAPNSRTLRRWLEGNRR